MQFLVSLLVPLTIFFASVSGNALKSNDLELNIYPYDRRNPLLTNHRVDPIQRRDPSPEPVPQGVYDIIVPPGGTPAGCVSTVPYRFSISPRQPGTPPGNARIEVCESASRVSMALKNGVLLDKQGKIGSIVANRQFQFDGPPAQAGAVYTGGWSVCDDGLLALGPSKNFFMCLSGTCKYFILLMMLFLLVLDAD
jgi:hypothetical protein